uniref:Retrotransposon gag domain-containing protein n=1 Tax=Trichogramma kaykai TaxID=54128 RepID=A0ABD2WF93_9HYME
MQLGGSARVEDTKPSAACNADCCFTGAHVASIQSVSSPYDDFRRVMNNVFFPPNPTQNSGILKDFSRSRGVLPSQDVDLLNSNNFNSTHGVLPSHSVGNPGILNNQINNNSSVRNNINSFDGSYLPRAHNQLPMSSQPLSHSHSHTAQQGLYPGFLHGKTFTFPNFWRHNPKLWLDCLKRKFIVKYVEHSKAKFNRFCDGLSNERDKTPSEFLDYLASARGTLFDRNAILCLWSMKLPAEIAVHLDSVVTVENENHNVARADEIFHHLNNGDRQMNFINKIDTQKPDSSRAFKK